MAFCGRLFFEDCVAPGGVRVATCDGIDMATKSAIGVRAHGSSEVYPSLPLLGPGAPAGQKYFELIASDQLG